VFDYLTYTLCYIHNGDASTQGETYLRLEPYGEERPASFEGKAFRRV